MTKILLLLLFCLPLHAEFTVHYMWGLWDTTPLPEEYQAMREHNQKLLKMPSILHEKGDIFLYVKQFSDEFDPALYDLFQKIPRKVCQADLGRYIIIYYLGGLYLDLDARVVDPNILLRLGHYPNGVWLTELICRPSNLAPREKPYCRRIAQYAFFMEEKRSPLLLQIIQESIRRVKVLFAECGDKWSDTDVLWGTGPDVVTTIVHETGHRNFKILNYFESWGFVCHECHSKWHGQKDVDAL